MYYLDIANKINSIYHDRQVNAQHDYEKRFDIAMQNEEFASLIKEKNRLITKKANLELANKDTSSIVAELSLVSKKLLEYIKSNKIDLNMYYTCPNCKDTGYANGKECECRKSIQHSLMKSISNLPKRSEGVSFNSNTFDDLDVPQASFMQKLYSKMKEWTENFNNSDKDVVFLSGEVGVGKTTLAYATANALQDKGYFVYYTTAFDINNLFVDKQFNRLSDLDTYNNAINSQLLIIDDLGTEVTNTIGLEYLFNVIDSRLAKGLKTFVITNLTLEKFSGKYGERAKSRLTNTRYSFAPKYIKGKDLRKI